jgi:hypothetical protein
VLKRTPSRQLAAFLTLIECWSMAIEYGAFVVDGLKVTAQTVTLAGTNVLTNADGFSPHQERLVFALARVGTAGWALVATYADNVNQTNVFIFTRQA